MKHSASVIGHAGENGLGNRVLVVDDDPAVRNSLKFSLEIEGYSVGVFSSAKEILALRELPEHGCLLIDYGLPDMTGLDLLERLRKRGVGLPAILITSNPGPILRYRAGEVGVSIVEKPLLGNGLTEAIRNAFSAHPA
jgi:FixJ family two-component response regulator